MPLDESDNQIGWGIAVVLLLFGVGVVVYVLVYR
jgi:hypothetical protein